MDRLENKQLNNCGQFCAVRDISIRPITVNEIEGVDGEEKGPLRTLKRRVSEILEITDQHLSVTAARRRSSGELGRHFSISGATQRVSVTNQDESTSPCTIVQGPLSNFMKIKKERILHFYNFF